MLAVEHIVQADIALICTRGVPSYSRQKRCTSATSHNIYAFIIARVFLVVVSFGEDARSLYDDVQLTLTASGLKLVHIRFKTWHTENEDVVRFMRKVVP